MATLRLRATGERSGLGADALAGRHWVVILCSYPYRATPGRGEKALIGAVSFQIVAIRTMDTKIKLLPLRPGSVLRLKPSGTSSRIILGGKASRTSRNLLNPSVRMLWKMSASAVSSRCLSVIASHFLIKSA